MIMEGYAVMYTDQRSIYYQAIPHEQWNVYVYSSCFVLFYFFTIAWEFCEYCNIIICFFCDVAADGTKVIVKTAYLSTLEVLDRLLEFCNAKDKSKDEAPLPQTKAARKK